MTVLVSSAQAKLSIFLCSISLRSTSWSGPMTTELAEEVRCCPITIDGDPIFPPTRGKSKSGRQRLEGSFEDLLSRPQISHFRFHDLRHTFASWYRMIGGDLYELAKILGHANIKMTERYAKLGHAHIAKTGATAKAIWTLLGSFSLQTKERPALAAMYVMCKLT